MNELASLGAQRQLAATLLKSGQPEQAHDVMQDVLKQAPNDISSFGFAALAALEAGRRSHALKHLKKQRKLLEKNHQTPQAWQGMAGLLNELGETSDAQAALASAVKIWPDHAPLHVQRAELLKALKRFETCQSSAEQALRIEPNNNHTMALLALALHKQGKFAEAADLYQKVVANAPADLTYYHNLGAALIGAGKASEAVDVCNKWLESEPTNVEALALKGHALQEAGRWEEANQLFDFEALVRPVTIDVPEGYSSLKEFNEALVQFIYDRPDLKTPPKNDLRYHHPKLKITADVLGSEEGPIAELEKAMRKAVKEYLERLKSLKNHPFAENVPENTSLYAWAALLDKQGNQNQHVHKAGYLSGCYYAQIPPEISEQDETQEGDIAGAFEVGRPPDEFGCHQQHMIKQYKPYEGLMMLFPAFMYHKTVPFRARSQRICVAFDVMADE